jgi:hypothetical protein
MNVNKDEFYLQIDCESLDFRSKMKPPSFLTMSSKSATFYLLFTSVYGADRVLIPLEFQLLYSELIQNKSQTQSNFSSFSQASNNNNKFEAKKSLKVISR